MKIMIDESKKISLFLTIYLATCFDTSIGVIVRLILNDSLENKRKFKNTKFSILYTCSEAIML